MDSEIIKQEPAEAQPIIPLTDLIAGYIESRDRIKVFDEEYDKNVTPLKEARDHFKGEIIKVFKDRREFSTRVPGATVSISVRRTPKIVDEAALIAYLRQLGLHEYIAERVTDVFKDAPLEELAKEAIRSDGTVDNSKLPPGVVFMETETITARSNEKKDARKVIEGDYVKKLNN